MVPMAMIVSPDNWCTAGLPRSTVISALADRLMNRGDLDRGQGDGADPEKPPQGLVALHADRAPGEVRRAALQRDDLVAVDAYLAGVVHESVARTHDAACVIA